MRSLALSMTLLAATASVSWGQGSVTSPKKEVPPAATRSGALTAGENQAARKSEEERQKRWDDRMRRATRSLCDRC